MSAVRASSLSELHELVNAGCFGVGAGLFDKFLIRARCPRLGRRRSWPPQSECGRRRSRGRRRRRRLSCRRGRAYGRPRPRGSWRKGPGSEAARSHSGSVRLSAGRARSTQRHHTCPGRRRPQTIPVVLFNTLMRLPDASVAPERGCRMTRRAVRRGRYCKFQTRQKVAGFLRFFVASAEVIGYTERAAYRTAHLSYSPYSVGDM